MHVANATYDGRDFASGREIIRWNWPTGARVLLAGAVISAGAALAVASRSVPESEAAVVKAPELLLDLNTVPARILETLPHVGQSLVRQVVAARERRPLVSLEDAGSRVRGLGPITLAQIAPYLRFGPAPQSGVDDPESANQDRPSSKPRSSGRKTSRSRKPNLAPVQPRLVARERESGTR